MRKSTTEVLEVFKFEDDTGEVIQWASGQLEIIDAIVNRSLLLSTESL